MSSDDFQWSPPGMSGSELDDYLALSAGLPRHAMESVIDWFFKLHRNSIYMDSSRLVEFQTARRKDLGFRNPGLIERHTLAQHMRAIGEVECTYLIDFTLSKRLARPTGYDKVVGDMKAILRQSGAGWEVVAQGGRWRLQEYLPGAILKAADEVMSAADRSSGLLRAAWEAAFGINKRPSHAYYDAVRAVEVYSCPLISPKDTDATLGKDINVLRNSGSKFNFALRGSRSVTGVDHLVGVLQLLWHSQTDRHGRADYEDVSEVEAQAAVLLAMTVTGWLSRGALSRAQD